MITDQTALFVEEGRANVFADISNPEPAVHQLKAQLVVHIAAAMKGRRMTQTAAAKATGTNQPEMSRILKGQFRHVSMERLMRMLTQLGCEVDIVVRPHGQPAKASVIHLTEAVPA